MLRGVDFELLVGALLVLVGVNGVGKLMLVLLFVRLYDLIGGWIMVDG